MLHQGGATSVAVDHTERFGQAGAVGGIEFVEINDADETFLLLFGRTTTRCADDRLRLLFRHS